MPQRERTDRKSGRDQNSEQLETVTTHKHNAYNATETSQPALSAQPHNPASPSQVNVDDSGAISWNTPTADTRSILDESAMQVNSQYNNTKYTDPGLELPSQGWLRPNCTRLPARLLFILTFHCLVVHGLLTTFGAPAWARLAGYLTVLVLPFIRSLTQHTLPLLARLGRAKRKAAICAQRIVVIAREAHENHSAIFDKACQDTLRVLKDMQDPEIPEAASEQVTPSSNYHGQLLQLPEELLLLIISCCGRNEVMSLRDTCKKLNALIGPRVIAKKGEGRSCQVHEMRFNECSEPFAEKRVREAIKWDHEDNYYKHVERLESEATIMRLFKHRQHPHLPQILQKVHDAAGLAIRMRPAADCNLNEYIAKHCWGSDYRPIFKRTMMQWFGCLASAVECLHNQWILHNDLKPDNILIENGSVCIGDFGISVNLKELTERVERGRVNYHSLVYCAPEVAEHADRSLPADIFSLGLIYLEILTVLCERSLDDLRTRNSKLYHMKIDWLKTYLQTLEIPDALADREGLPRLREDFRQLKKLIGTMIEADQSLRPKASKLVFGPTFQMACCTKSAVSVTPQTRARSSFQSVPPATYTGQSVPMLSLPTPIAIQDVDRTADLAQIDTVPGAALGGQSDHLEISDIIMSRDSSLDGRSRGPTLFSMPPTSTVPTTAFPSSHDLDQTKEYADGEVSTHGTLSSRPLAANDQVHVRAQRLRETLAIPGPWTPVTPSHQSGRQG